MSNLRSKSIKRSRLEEIENDCLLKLSSTFQIRVKKFNDIPFVINNKDDINKINTNKYNTSVPQIVEEYIEEPNAENSIEELNAEEYIEEPNVEENIDELNGEDFINIVVEENIDKLNGKNFIDVVDAENFINVVDNSEPNNSSETSEDEISYFNYYNDADVDIYSQNSDDYVNISLEDDNNDKNNNNDNIIILPFSRLSGFNISESFELSIRLQKLSLIKINNNDNTQLYEHESCTMTRGTILLSKYIF